MSSNRLLCALLACAGLVLGPAAANATVLTDIGSNFAGAGNNVSVTTTAAVSSGQKLVVVVYTNGTPSTPTGITGCTADPTPAISPGGTIQNTSIYSWTCASGLALGTSINTNYTTGGQGIIWVFSAALTTQNLSNGSAAALSTNPTFTTGAFSSAPQVLIEATGIVSGDPAEIPSAGCTSLGDAPGGPPSGADLWVSECPISSTSAFTYSSSIGPSTHNWMAPYTSFVTGSSSVCNGGLLLRGAGGC